MFLWLEICMYFGLTVSLILLFLLLFSLLLHTFERHMTWHPSCNHVHAHAHQQHIQRTLSLCSQVHEHNEHLCGIQNTLMIILYAAI